MIGLVFCTFALAPVDVDMTLSPAAQNVPFSCVAKVELILTAPAFAPVSAVDAVLSWDPSKLTLLQAIPSGEDWFASGFLNDPDGINADLLDGDALYTSLAAPLNPVIVQPDALVATFEFLVIDSGGVNLLASLGGFGASRVVGINPGEIVTGALSGPASIANGGLATSEVNRLGVPPNPDVFRPGLTGGPVIGETWEPYVDHTSFAPGALLDFLFFTLTPTNLVIAPFGTLLCLPPTVSDGFTALPGLPFAVRIPNNCVFVGLTVCSQTVALLPAGDPQLTNALDITIGTF